MNKVGKAIWYIESHLEEEVSLGAVAEIAGLSRFHLLRLFSAGYGMTVMGYVRARRLSEAAKTLAGGNAGILDVALGAGYGSHEAFTRAFTAQFAITPEKLRAGGRLDKLKLTESLKMDEELLANLPEPKLVEADGLLLAGLKKRYGTDTSTAIPMQWQQFQPFIGNITGQKSNTAYGVLLDSDEDGNIDYLTGVEVSGFGGLNPELEALRLAPQKYAVFNHEGDVSQIRRTWHTIFAKWLPGTSHRPADAPQFERYGEDFDPVTGTGTIEIWIPLAP